MFIFTLSLYNPFISLFISDYEIILINTNFVVIFTTKYWYYAAYKYPTNNGVYLKQFHLVTCPWEPTLDEKLSLAAAGTFCLKQSSHKYKDGQ